MAIQMTVAPNQWGADQNADSFAGEAAKAVSTLLDVGSGNCIGITLWRCKKKNNDSNGEREYPMAWRNGGLNVRVQPQAVQTYRGQFIYQLTHELTHAVMEPVNPPTLLEECLAIAVSMKCLEVMNEKTYLCEWVQKPNDAVQLRTWGELKDMLATGTSNSYASNDSRKYQHQVARSLVELMDATNDRWSSMKDLAAQRGQWDRRLWIPEWLRNSNS